MLKIDIKDLDFRKLIIENVTPNSQGDITIEELASIKELNCSYKNIKTLKGLEFFTGLKVLNCSGNKLRYLDVSNNRLLEKIDCSKNIIKKINLENTNRLVELNCGYNRLTKLDLSYSNSLSKLYCHCNQIETLIIILNYVLKDVYCFKNPLGGRCFNYRQSIVSLKCDQHQLSNFRPSTCPNLKKIDLVTYLCDDLCNIWSVGLIKETVVINTFDENSLNTIVKYNHEEEQSSLKKRIDSKVICHVLGENSEEILESFKLFSLKLPDTSYRDSLLDRFTFQPPINKQEFQPDEVQIHINIGDECIPLIIKEYDKEFYLAREKSFNNQIETKKRCHPEYSMERIIKLLAFKFAQIRIDFNFVYSTNDYKANQKEAEEQDNYDPHNIRTGATYLKDRIDFYRHIFPDFSQKRLLCIVAYSLILFNYQKDVRVNELLKNILQNVTAN